MIAIIKTTGKEKDYELIEYISNVNTQYTQVLMELNENGAMDAAYIYGVSRLTEDRFTGESNFYLYDPAGNVAGITDQDGYLWQSYRYDAFGNATFGSPQYDNEYTFNGESYNPNIHSQYLRARYYDTVKGGFLTEDSCLGDIRNPLTLNRYSYCIGNPLFYSDPSGYRPSPYDEIDFVARDNGMMNVLQERQIRVNSATDSIYNWLGESSGMHNQAKGEQLTNGFLEGFAGSFYATYDTITHPEYVLASMYYAGTHPAETAKGAIKGFVMGNSDETVYNVQTGNYRAIGKEAGYAAGGIAQAALAKAAANKCGDFIDKKQRAEFNGGGGDAKNPLLSRKEIAEKKLADAANGSRAEGILLGKDGDVPVYQSQQQLKKSITNAGAKYVGSTRNGDGQIYHMDTPYGAVEIRIMQEIPGQTNPLLDNRTIIVRQGSVGKGTGAYTYGNGAPIRGAILKDVRKAIGHTHGQTP